VLTWDSAVVYAFEREPFQREKLEERSHRRLELEHDGAHPVAASHHQKIVVIDDALAFCGGLDVCSARWDTPAHTVDDPRRVDPPWKPHRPFHDVQAVVTGGTAAALGTLARERWRRAIGVALDVPAVPANAAAAISLGSIEVAAELVDVQVAVARTEPAFDGRPAVHEVERTHASTLAGARDAIYIENQYFTSPRLGEVLGELLERPAGPAVVLVLPTECSGWLEQATMGVRRAALLERLRARDRHDRLRLYHPVLPDRRTPLNVHSKVTIVDDAVLRVGSANLSNRSFGLDTECDLLFLGETAAHREAIAGVRARLLAEHLDVPVPLFLERARAVGLVEAIESLRGRAKTLEPLPPPEIRVTALTSTLTHTLAPFADPEMPAPIDPLVNRALGGPPARRRARAAVAALAAVALCLLFVGVWLWTPLASFVRPKVLYELLSPLVEGPYGPLLGAAIVCAATLCFAPLLPLVAASALLFPSAPVSMVVSLSGAMTTAAVQYLLGRGIGARTMARLIGRERIRASSSLGGRGTVAIAFLRLLPVAPFSLLNLAAGAARVPPSPFFFGTFLGLLPGVIGLAWIGNALLRVLPHPTPIVAVGVAVSLVVALAVARLTVRVRRRRRDARATTSARAPSVESGPALAVVTRS
jgi:phosphatidylserine/phosphatidylglycerophosphate/cardiolipin synthase-like enzyme/uncharacterized membrane protein YdjX (TVP38/TMEM64 family)